MAKYQIQIQTFLQLGMHQTSVLSQDTDSDPSTSKHYKLNPCMTE